MFKHDRNASSNFEQFRRVLSIRDGFEDILRWAYCSPTANPFYNPILTQIAWYNRCNQCSNFRCSTYYRVYYCCDSSLFNPTLLKEKWKKNTKYFDFIQYKINMWSFPLCASLIQWVKKRNVNAKTLFQLSLKPLFPFSCYSNFFFFSKIF